MPRMTRRYIKPIDVSTGADMVESDHGKYTLVASRTYRFVLAGSEPALQSIHLTGYTAALIVTSATVQTCDHAEQDVTNSDTAVGNWINEDPGSPAFVAVDGTGWSVTNCVVAAAGGNLGGARWNLANNAAARTALTIVVGGTGGDVRVSAHGKMP